MFLNCADIYFVSKNCADANLCLSRVIACVRIGFHIKDDENGSGTSGVCVHCVLGFFMHHVLDVMFFIDIES